MIYVLTCLQLHCSVNTLGWKVVAILIKWYRAKMLSFLTLSRNYLLVLRPFDGRRSTLPKLWFLLTIFLNHITGSGDFASLLWKKITRALWRCQIKITELHCKLPCVAGDQLHLLACGWEQKEVIFVLFEVLQIDIKMDVCVHYC